MYHMYHYYLSPDNGERVLTIYIVNDKSPMAERDSNYLMARMGCELITERVAFGLNLYSRLAGLGSLWARTTSKSLRTMIDDAVLDDAIQATRETIDFYQGMGQ